MNESIEKLIEPGKPGEGAEPAVSPPEISPEIEPLQTEPDTGQEIRARWRGLGVVADQEAPSLGSTETQTGDRPERIKTPKGLNEIPNIRVRDQVSAAEAEEQIAEAKDKVKS